MKRAALLPSALAALIFVSGCAEKSEWHETFALGTFCRLRFYEKAGRSVAGRVFARVHEIENITSANKSGTELDIVNKSAGIKPVTVNPELITVLSTALHYAELSKDENGRAAFDPTIGVLVKLWNIGTDSARLPEDYEIQEALPLVNWRKVIVNKDKGTVYLAEKGMRLDLGGIAKGYAADEAVRILKEEGVKNALLDFGGNLYALGRKGSEGYYTIGVQDPEKPRGEYIGLIQLAGRSIVTSATYERNFELNGVYYHHILSTFTGYPVENELLSVTIVAPDSMDADALSTTVFALGYEKGSALVNSISEAESIYILKDGSIRVSEGLKTSFRSEKWQKE
ncbi:MAG: FAD:protein FMN transferase [Spirochaetaceae bacterium]|jgi:thiamine biosynthesis lipoprotein|nr:FAD:protein FMN transferase [Spirochaetaceae bacterium]